MTSYEIDEEFLTDPITRGWNDVGASPTPITWDGVKEAIGGDFNLVPAGGRAKEYKNILGKSLADYIVGEFTFNLDLNGTGGAYGDVGFFNSVHDGRGLYLLFKATKLSLFLQYTDDTTDYTSEYTLTEGVDYRAVVSYNPSDEKAYLDLYNVIDGSLLHSSSITVAVSKGLYIDVVGAQTHATVFGSGAEEHIWINEIKAISEVTVDYTGLYCTPSEARQMTNMDVDEVSDDTLITLQRLFVMPRIDAVFRAEGYATPFDTGEDTPPIIRALAAILTAGYAAKREYTGHDPNESPAYRTLMGEATDIYKKINNGEIEVQDINGTIITRTQSTSSDMLSTTDGQLTLFTRDDPPNIEEVMSGRLYIGRTDAD